MDSTENMTRNNHYVPQAYLKAWSDDGHHLYCYDSVVPDERYPEWNRRGIDHIACWDDFYTKHIEGVDDDDFEKYMKTNFEDPAFPCIRKAIDGQNVSSGELNRIIDYLIAQLVRTPAWFINANEAKRRIAGTYEHDAIMSIIDRQTGNTSKQHATLSQRDLFAYGPEINVFIDDRSGIRFNYLFGRRTFLNSARSFIEGPNGDVLRDCYWRIFDMPDGYQLFASDNPVVVFARFDTEDYACGPSLGFRDGTDMFMPISPHKFIFTEIGATKDTVDSINPTAPLGELLQRLTVFNATRYIYASKPFTFVAENRPRTKNIDFLKRLREANRDWNKIQGNYEDNFDDIGTM